MSKRLSEVYAPGDLAEIHFGGERWWPVLVVRSDPPGLWVRDQGGREWFVTNGRRIRPLEGHEEHDSK